MVSHFVISLLGRVKNKIQISYYLVPGYVVSNKDSQGPKLISYDFKMQVLCPTVALIKCIVHVTNIILMAGKIVQLVKYLLCNYMDINSNPSTQVNKQIHEAGTVLRICYINTREAETRESLWIGLATLVKSVSSRLMAEFSSKKDGSYWEGSKSCCPHRASGHGQL